MKQNLTAPKDWRKKWYIIIFESNTPRGKSFDIILLWFILLSILTVLLESVLYFRTNYFYILKVTEWFFTISFTVEYIVRVIVSPKKKKYIFSFFGIIDLLAVLPTYFSLLTPGFHFLMVIRAFRLLRIFKVLHLNRYFGASQSLLNALWASRFKITVFIGTVLSIAIIVGTLMYLVEGPENGFTSIPMGIYFSLITLTTVGFGDITPQTSLGKIITSMLTILGYGIIAVPTGIVTAQLTSQAMDEKKGQKKRNCPDCMKSTFDPDALFCTQCGAILPSDGDVTEL